ncbi:hypothetical protein [Afifella sp. IM 167]|uniref:hypothetical protein n=1 Tax=Afifella sp. IM 167 TaxID=2033586 RepID=UPI001CCBD836|nr:hypothetical protein [Afifella sp. IM 167]MBZ8133235.1 hypothetical protein [Afifella sp. IM 167]
MAALPTLEDDPCGRAAALSALRDAIMTGEKIGRIRYRTANGEREIEYRGQSLADVTAELEIARRACEGKSGLRRRYAKRFSFI